MNDQIYDLLLKDDEITWQSIILDLIKTEQMNPWDVDITVLCKRYLETLKELKEQNFVLSGKVVLAAALLLRIKSSRLLEEDLAGFDQLLFPPEIEDIGDYIEPGFKERVKEFPRLAIKTPQARKRRVTLKDLIGALQKVLETNRRKVRQRLEEAHYYHPTIPEKKVDMSKLIDELYIKLQDHFKQSDGVPFTKIIPENPSKEDKIYAFAPLLHLSNQTRIHLRQEKHFGDITIKPYTPEEYKEEEN